MYEITITVEAGQGENNPKITLQTTSRANARAMVLLADENASVISAVATKMAAPRVVKFKGVGDVAPKVAPPATGKKGK